MAPCGHPQPCGCRAGGECCEECKFDPHVCIDDIKGSRSHILVADRDASIRRVVKAGVGVPIVASRLGLSERTVYRIVEG